VGEESMLADRLRLRSILESVSDMLIFQLLISM
jgi:hypothetical protein